MEFMVLDSNFDGVMMVDTYLSAIWTVRYDQAGDFELYMPVRQDYLEGMQIGRYLWRRDSDRLMVIETVEIDCSADDGYKLTVKGRSLESILDRRIIADTLSYETDTSINTIVKDILTGNVISPSKAARKIDNFTYKETTDTRITGIKVTTTFRGESVYDAIVALCQTCKIGFRVLPKGAGGFEFELYMGEDRSYNQNENPYVVFSPSFENLYSSNYIKSFQAYKNSIFAIGTYQKEIATEEETTDSNGNTTTTTTTTYEETEVSTWAKSEDSEPSGLSRRETFVDCNSLSEGEQGGEESTWIAVAAQKGTEELSEYKTTTAFEGELDAVRQYVLGEDFDIGDIVQVENEFGITATVYISEMIFSHDDTGLTITPTFTATEEEKMDESTT